MGLGGSSKLESSTVIDIITIGVLGFDAYLLYSSLGYGGGNIFSVTTDPKIIAVQLTAALIAVYFLEFLYDRKIGGSSDPLS